MKEGTNQCTLFFLYIVPCSLCFQRKWMTIEPICKFTEFCWVFIVPLIKFINITHSKKPHIICFPMTSIKNFFLIL